MTRPPSAHSTWPVMAAAASETRYATAAAVSPGVSGRLRAWPRTTASKCSSAFLARAPGVSVRPGATADTAMPSAPRVTASVRITPSSAPLLAMYASIAGFGGAQTVSEAMNTMRPNRRSAMPGANACTSHNADSTLTACTRRQVAASTSAIVARSIAAAARVDASDDRSQATSASRSRIAVRWPVSRSAVVIDHPMAPAPPVMTATRSGTSRTFSFCGRRRPGGLEGGGEQIAGREAAVGPPFLGDREDLLLRREMVEVVGGLDGLAERQVARQDDILPAERDEHRALHGPGADTGNLGQFREELVVGQAAQDVLAEPAVLQARGEVAERADLPPGQPGLAQLAGINAEQLARRGQVIAE